MTAPTPFEWLAQIAIPTAGVLASTAVAIAAFRTSRRATQIAEQAHRDELARQEMDDRREFADVFGALLNKRPDQWATGPYQPDVQRVAETAPAGAAALADWYFSTYEEIAQYGSSPKGIVLRRDPDQVGLREEAEARLRSWLRTGTANVEPFNWARPVDDAAGPRIASDSP